MRYSAAYPTGAERFAADQAFSAKARNMSALAALSVVVIHAGAGGMGSFMAKMMHQFLGWGLCTFAVPWFFFASGYFFARHLDEKGWWLRAMRTRLRTLVLPYVIWCALFVCFAAALALLLNLDAGRPAATGLSWRWLMLKGFGLDVSDHPLLVPFWYIRSLMVIVCLSPVLVWTLRRWRWWVPVAILPAYVYCCGLNNCHVMPWFFFYGFFSLTGWIYFSAGVLARRGNWAARSCSVPLWLCWTVAFVAVCVGRLALYRGMPGVAGCLWIAGIPPLMLGVWRLVPDRPWPAWIVTAAFPVYALHYFFVHFLESTALPLAHPAWWAYVMRAVLAAGLSLWVAYLLHRFLPRESRVLFGGR